jgi:pyridoxal phosphate enzyme (YggS family)
MTDAAPSVDAVRSRLADVRARVDAVERRFTHRVDIVGVTKGHGAWAVAAAVGAGCDGVGENYAQELLAKRTELDRLRPVVHFIGRLQRNKVRQLVDVVDVWASVDRASLADEIARRAAGATVLVQVDTTGDPAKGGCPVGDVAALVDHAVQQGLVVAGLMTVGPTDRPSEAARAGFRTVRSLTDELGLAVCSMGMSGDLTVAVEEGSTQLRIGTALFGARPPVPRAGRSLD